MKAASLLAALALAACAAPASGPAPASGFAASPNQCFYISQINNFASADQTVVNFRVRVSEIWRVELRGACPGLGFGLGNVGLKQRAGSSGRVCSANDVDVVALSSNIPITCDVRTLRRLTDAEIAVLPDNQKP